MIERCCPTLSGGVLRREFARTAGAFAVLMLLGYLLALLLPEVAQAVLARFSAQLSSLGLGEESSSLQTLRLLFSNNVTALLLTLLYGVVPLLYLSALSLGTNAMLLGLFAAVYQREGYGLAAYFIGVLPHGIFELPALVLSCALGLLVCAAGTDRVRRVEGAPSFLLRLRDCLRVYFCVCVPLLVCAAVVETYITPLLLSAAL